VGCRTGSKVVNIEPRRGPARIKGKPNTLEVLSDQLIAYHCRTSRDRHDETSPTMPGGQSGTVTVALQKGS